MEIYEPKSHKNSDEDRSDVYDNKPVKGKIFPTRALNRRLPLWEKLTFFFIGFVGLQLVAILLDLILSYTSAYDDPVYGSALLNFLSYLVIFVAIMLLMGLDKRHTLITFFRSFKDVKAIEIGILGFIVLMIVSAIFSLLYSLIPYYGANNNQTSIEVMADSYPALIILTTVIFAPFTEEMTYRVGLGDSIGRKHPVIGIIISSLIFGLIHFDFTAITDLITAEEIYKETALINLYNELLNLPIYVCSGAILCFTYFFSGKLSSSYLVHLLNNAFSVITILI